MIVFGHRRKQGGGTGERSPPPEIFQKIIKREKLGENYKKLKKRVEKLNENYEKIKK